MSARFLYNYFRDYDPSIGRYIQSDPIGLGGGINTYGYAEGNPLSNSDPLGLYCTSRNGWTTCRVPGGPSFSIPTGSTDGSFGWSPLLHDYIVRRSTGCVSDDVALQALIANPTPGPDPNVATPSGTANNAPVPPFFSKNPVTSYLTNDLNTGAPVVVNFTGPNSAFPTGFVARTVSNGVVSTYGRGNNWKQAPLVGAMWGLGLGAVVQAALTDLFWGRQTDDFLSKCLCSR